MDGEKITGTKNGDGNSDKPGHLSSAVDSKWIEINKEKEEIHLPIRLLT